MRLVSFALSTVVAAVLAVAAPAFAQKKAEDSAVGYGGAKVQLQPFMVPVRNNAGQVRFEVVTIRLVLGPAPRDRPACFSIPIVHEKLLLYFFRAKLVPGDLIGQRREVLAKSLLDVAIKSTQKGYYSAVELVQADDKLTDPVSLTLTSQCK
ncbi:MAG: hypothetical protein FJX59_08630 [Alphaproteobacteria bacterium]|nr:hypothetical protein [Alphaproteobacteria bacterium]